MPTPLYDLLTEMLGLGVPSKLRLVDKMEIPPAGVVLDIGTGTGLVPILLLQGRPDLIVVGLDADLAILGLARKNALRAGVSSVFEQGLAERLPFAAHRFDVVVSSLALHHLPKAAKLAACQEMGRVLKPGGLCYVADFAPPQTRWARVLSVVPRLMCFAHIADNFQGRIPGFLEAAGFVDIEELFQTHWSVSLYRAMSGGIRAGSPSTRPFGRSTGKDGTKGHAETP